MTIPWRLWNCPGLLLLCLAAGCEADHAAPDIAPLAERPGSTASEVPPDRPAAPADRPPTAADRPRVRSKPAPQRHALVPLRGRPSASHARMLAELQKCAEQAERAMPFEAGRLDYLYEQLAAKDPQDHHPYLIALFDAAQEELRMGHAETAAGMFGEAAAFCEEHLPKIVPAVVYRWGVASMRVGESLNCCARHTAESCILPIQGGGIHTEQSGSRQAIECFTRVLKMTGDDEQLHLKARWLLNIAYMTLGEYPQDVPEEYLIPPSAFASEEEFPRFENVAPRLGLAFVNRAGGAVCDDFDGDGYLDIVTSQFAVRGQMRFFHNNGDGTFADRTEEAGLGGMTGGLNMVQADYDNDGLMDIYVIRGAWWAGFGQHPDSLLRNNGDGTFTDEAFAAGLCEVNTPSQAAAWADYDNDGDVDIFVGGESTPDFACRSQLFRNEGDGTFTDVAAQAGVTNERFAKGCTWGDYDGDGDPDLYVSNFEGENRLYQNRGDGTFVDVAPQARVAGPHTSFPTWFWDYNNDGALDLWVATYFVLPHELTAIYLGLPHGHELHAMYRGDGRGGFENATLELNLPRPVGTMGSNFGDLDNDGFLDFYLGTGEPDYETLDPSVVYHNQGGRRFADVTTAGGFAHLQKGHSVSFADLDQDGDQDVFEEMGGAYPGDGFNNVLFANPGFGNHFLAVRPIGTRSNRAAIGARIRVVIVEDGQERTIYKHVNWGGSFGANPLRQTIGLGRAERIVTLEVLWPGGETQSLADLPLDATVQIVQGSDEAVRWNLRTLSFGGKAPASAVEQ